MGTTPDPGSVLFGDTRRAILSLAFTRPDETFYLREVVRRTGKGTGAVQRELAQLTACGILRKTGGKFYGANSDSPLFEPLTQLVVRTTGVADVLRDAIHRSGLSRRVAVAFLFGSFARGEHHAGSDVDLMVVTRDRGGRAFPEDLSAALLGAQSTLGREVNPFVLPAPELAAKAAAGNHFICRVLAAEKIYLIGGPDDLGRLAEERVAQAPRADGRRGRRPARHRRP
jgi:predicted nucleotidyltransferase